MTPIRTRRIRAKVAQVAILGLLALLVMVALAYGVGLPNAASAQAPQKPDAVSLRLVEVVAGGELDKPVGVVSAGDARLFVVERAGRIRIVQPDGTVLPVSFLDITDRVEWETGGERGLLGLAFHPDYTNNGYFYVNYTAKPDGATHIARFEVTSDANVADPASEFTILTVEQPYSNHNAGDLAFGPEGYLYIPLGDGGSSNDPGNRAQDPQELLGKLLRIDVDGGTPYAIPADNPFVGNPDVRDEIWALGLRNPWRISFDSVTHDLYIADVGQGNWEEVNFQPADSAGGENYGWSCYEGTHYNDQNSMPSCGPAASYTMPIFEYSHSEGNSCSVTGGYVYRGSSYPQLAGLYFLTDFCSGIFWDLQPAGGGWQATRHDNLQRGGFVAFGEGVDGELYLVNIYSGALYRLTGIDLPNRIFLPIGLKEG